MIEDKLDKYQRIRLEALNQANQTHAMTSPRPETVLETARLFEAYIKDNATRLPEEDERWPRP